MRAVFSDTGIIFSAWSRGIPRVRARLALGSASMAKTLKPLWERTRARVPAMVVFPTPPFPETAIFNFLPSGSENKLTLLTHKLLPP